MSEAEARTFSIFNRIQYWLSIVEASMIGLSIFFEIVGCAGLASICGVLGVGKSTETPLYRPHLWFFYRTSALTKL